MCGIVGYIGPKNNLVTILNILNSLEYRGRDGAGISINGSIIKSIGPPSQLQEKVLELGLEKSIQGINSLVAHTRWATHGKKEFEKNVHPHHDHDKRFIVVHNGMISNSGEIKKEYLSEYEFYSETDTEIVPALLATFAKEFPEKSTSELIKQVLDIIEGTYGFIIADNQEPNTFYAIRSGSPLSLGKSSEGIFICSDETKLHKYTDKVITLDVGDLCIIRPDGYSITNIETGNSIKREERAANKNYEEADKGVFPFWTEKELVETPERILDTTRGRIDTENNEVVLNGISKIQHLLPQIQRVIIVGCGTSRNAGIYGKMMLEKYAGISCEVIDASTFIEMNPRIDSRTLVIALSQSGETADVRSAVAEAKKRGAVLLGVINAVDSMIAKMCGQGIYIQVGPEIAVASTKAFFGQCSILCLIAIALGRSRSLSATKARVLIQELVKIPKLMTAIQGQRVELDCLLEKTLHKHHMLISSYTGWAGICEAKLKMEELCYLPVSAELSGSLKHGPLAMISPENHNVVIACLTGNTEGDARIKDTLAIALSSGAQGIVIAPESVAVGDYSTGTIDVIRVGNIHPDLVIFLQTYVLQWYTYLQSVELGNDPDHPRNLAKSVTV